MSEQVLITGAASGIGRAAARLLAGSGWTVIALDRHEGGLRALTDELGSRLIPRVLDLTDLTEHTALDPDGPLSALIQCAGVFQPTDFLTGSLAAWRRVFTVNFEAAHLLDRLVAPALIANGGGAIVHVTSIHAWLSENQSSHYDAAKGALAALTRTLAIELAPHNIRVNSVAPGFVRTRMSIVDGVDELESELFRTHYAGRRRIPLARRRAGGDRGADCLPGGSRCFLHHGSDSGRGRRAERHVLGTSNDKGSLIGICSFVAGRALSAVARLVVNKRPDRNL